MQPMEKAKNIKNIMNDTCKSYGYNVQISARYEDNEGKIHFDEIGKDNVPANATVLNDDTVLIEIEYVWFENTVNFVLILADIIRNFQNQKFVVKEIHKRLSVKTIWMIIDN